MKRQYLEFSIKHQKIERTDTFEVVGGSRGYLWVRFTFCDDWSDETIKYAVFTGGGRPYPMLIENGVCEIPWEVLRLKRFYVGCIAGELLTTNPARVDVGEWCLDDTDPNIEPTPTMFYAIMKSLKGLEMATEDEIAAAVEQYMQENPVEAGNGIYIQPNEPKDAPDGSLWMVHPTESKPKGISLYYAGDNEADLKNAPNGSVRLAPKSSNKPATPEGGITEETDPTVPDWAKQPQKPPYTAKEVGAATIEDINQAIANLPTSGGKEQKWEEIINVTVTENVNKVLIDKDINGNPFALKELTAFVVLAPVTGATANERCCLQINGALWNQTGSLEIVATPKETESTVYAFAHITTLDGYMWKDLIKASANYSTTATSLADRLSSNQTASPLTLYVDAATQSLKKVQMPCTKIGLGGLSGLVIAAGSKLIVRGVRA